ncbi:hypothetical protein L6164_035059 [Bauhinia variegata]|uniref:Uncharacterized protein n=1 Tax=Bauhinia variegata TaxID=167791 RepID=A0ACB9KXA5_BAUVA|nr:hypothetical protein L6164_035059 [Bauhinia variegata]
MDGSSQATQSPTEVGFRCNSQNSRTPNDDQLFLLYFIMGTYFGPDIKGMRSQKSVLQRIAEGLPPYTADQLTSSHMKIAELERLYYYVLRKADKSVIVKLPLLHQFMQGNIYVRGRHDDANYPQLPDLFPSELHPQSRFKSYKIIENIVLINNPATFYMKSEDTERFKRLSGLEDFQLYRNVVEGSFLCNAGGPEVHPTQACSSSRKARRSDDFSELEDPLQHVHVVAPVNNVPYNGTNMMYSYMATAPDDDSDPERVSPAMIFLPSRPTKKEWSNMVASTKNGFALTGSAAMGQVGPIIGLMDIGECDDSYLFRISLPGVKRDEREFSCEIDTEGKVFIRGVTTTGEKTVYRYSQVFEMQTQNLCPPGHFSISFELPGPVDPHQFSGNFGTDGILEGIVMKGSHKR